MRGSHNQFLGYLTAIYAQCNRIARTSLWDSLLQINQQILWIIGGDFNAIAQIQEHAGKVSPDFASIRDFSNFITDAALIELPTSGGPFTWTGIRSFKRVWKCLDRLLVNQFWLHQPWCSSVEV